MQSDMQEHAHMIDAQYGISHLPMHALSIASKEKQSYICKMVKDIFVANITRIGTIVQTLLHGPWPILI